MQEPTNRLPALLAALLALFTAYVGFVNLQPTGSPRPNQTAPPTSQAGGQDVVARLWEDPFGPVREAHKDSSQHDSSHSPEAFRNSVKSRLADTNYPHVRVLALTVSGLPFAESAEDRLRLRYALQMALLEHRLRPHDRHHVGYVEVPWPRRASGSNDTVTNLVPYEWFKGGPTTNRVALVVLWLAEEELAEAPLPRLNHLLGMLLPPVTSQTNAGGRIEVALIGPRSSDTLRRLAHETDAATLKPSPPAPFGAIRLYSPFATAPDAFLTGECVPGRSHMADQIPRALAEAFADPRDLHRTFTNLALTDDVLMGLLVEELELRGIRARQRAGNHHRIVLISESDTFFGRALPAAFIAAAQTTNALPHPAHVAVLATGTSRPPAHITIHSYLRGLDGRSARSALSASDAGGGASSADETAARRALRRENERAAGESQMDYLERLGREMGEEDRRLRRRSRPFDPGGIRAVGVLGSDAYDKLRILQTLRAHLPEAVFFTTDLDARLWDAENLAFARNLLIASGFGLRPWDEPALKGEAWTTPPPFRDSYQSAAYIGATAALADWGLHQGSPAGVGRWPGHGVYEIGWHGPIPLKSSPLQSRAVATFLDGVTSADIARSASETPAGNAGHRPDSAAGLQPPGLGPWQWLGLLMSGLGGWGLYRCWRTWVNGIESTVGSTLPSGQPWLPRWLRRGLFAYLRRRAFRGLRWPEDPPALVERHWRRETPASPPARLLHRPWGGCVRHAGLERLRQQLQAGWLAGGALALALTFGLALQDAGRAGGEPFAWRAGVSVWPTILVRVLLIWLVAWVIVWAWLHHRQRRLFLWYQYFAPEKPEKDARAHGFAGLAWHRQRRAAEASLPPTSQTHETVSATLGFMDFVDRARLGPRYGRVLTWTAAYLIFGFGLFFLLGTPVRPFRGGLAESADFLSLLSAVTGLVVVTFYVLDATSLFRRLLGPLAERVTHWPDWVVQRKALLLGFEPGPGEVGTTSPGGDSQTPNRYRQMVEGLLDVRVAAHLTREFGYRFYMPFGLLLLLFISRSQLFDRWPWTPPLVLIHLCCVLLIVACALLLRNTARQVRNAAVERLERLCQRARLNPGAGLDLKSVEHVLREVQTERRGAYAPLIQDPSLIALLIPSGGYGLFLLLVGRVMNGG